MVEVVDTEGARMEHGFLSHVLLWTIGGMTICSLVTAIGAAFALGRQAYKD